MVERGPRRGASSSTAASIVPAAGSPGAPSGIPIGATRSSPVCHLPGATRWPTLAAWKLTVKSASTAAPATSPLEASTPEAMSQATTGAPQASIASIAPSAGSRGSPAKPVPKIASTIAPEPASRGVEVAAHMLGGEALQVGGGVAAQLLRRPEQQRLDLEAGLGQVARGDQPVAGVVALAADDPHRPVERQLADRLRHRPPSRLHQLQRGHPHLLDRPAIDRTHPASVVEGARATGSMRRMRYTTSLRRRGLLQADDQLRRRQVVLAGGAEGEEADALQVLLRLLEVAVGAGDQRVGEAQGGRARRRSRRSACRRARRPRRRRRDRRRGVSPLSEPEARAATVAGRP